MNSTSKTSTTRRSFLSSATSVGAGGAALALTILPALAVDDPVFAAIEAHRAASAAHLAAINEAARLETLGGFGSCEWGLITEKPFNDEDDALETLLDAGATSIGGLLAKLEYLRAIADSEGAWILDEREGVALQLIDSITASLRNVGVLS